MATLTEQLDALIAEHQLCSITLCRITREDGSCFWAIDVQSEFADGGRAIGSSGYEHTDPASGLREAINDLNARRLPEASVPELEVA